MKYLRGFLKDNLVYIRLLAFILLIVTIILGVLWCLKPDGGYEPWIFVPGTLSTLLGVPSIPDYINSLRHKASREDEKGSLSFLIQLSASSKGYWSERNQALDMRMIPPFNQSCFKSFQIDIERIAKRASKRWIRSPMEYRDPCFDITIISELDSSTVIHELGLEIVSVAHQMGGYGDVQAEKIILHASYTAEIPDLRSMVVTAKVVPPQKINFSIPVVMPDPFKVEPENAFRYELLLHNFVDNMPNLSILRFWAKTHKRHYESDCIYIFTL
jgi:hypothetical protein